MQNILMIGTFYAVPKILSHLYQKARQKPANTIFYRAIKGLSLGIDSAGKALGVKGCFVWQEVLADNVWISAVALCVLLKNKPLFKSHAEESLCFLITGSALSWLVRYGAGLMMPPSTYPIMRYIAPRSLLQPQSSASNQKESTHSYTSLDDLKKDKIDAARKAFYTGGNFSDPNFDTSKS
jgi:hypothetical protein